MNKDLIILILSCIIIILFFNNLFTYHNNRILKQSINNLNNQIKEKEDIINTLQGQIDSLVSHQVKLEKRIAIKKKEREKLKENYNNITKIEELCYEFKKMGYNPICR